MKLQRLFICLLLSMVCLAGCSNGSGDGDGAGPRQVSGFVSMDGPVAPASIFYESGDGTILASVNTLEGINGMFISNVYDLPSLFFVTVVFDDPTKNGAIGHLRAVGEGYDEENDTVQVNIVTTLVAEYMAAHPEAAPGEAKAAVLAYLELPGDFDVANAGGHPFGDFDNQTFLTAAADDGSGFSHFTRSLASGIDGVATRNFRSYNASGVSTVDFDALASMIGTSLFEGAMASLGGELFGMGLEAVGINWFGGDTSKLADMQADLTHMALDIQNLAEDVQSLGGKIRSDFETLEYMTLYANLGGTIANIKTWNQDLRGYADEAAQGLSVDPEESGTLRTSILSNDGYQESLHDFQAGTSASGLGSSAINILLNLSAPHFYRQKTAGKLLVTQFNQFKGLQLMVLNLLTSAYTDSIPPDIEMADAKLKNYYDYVSEQFSMIPIPVLTDDVLVDIDNSYTWTRSLFGPYDDHGWLMPPSQIGGYSYWEVPDIMTLKEAFEDFTVAELKAAGFDIEDGDWVWTNNQASSFHSGKGYEFYTWDFSKQEMVKRWQNTHGGKAIFVIRSSPDISIGDCGYDLTQMSAGGVVAAGGRATTTISIPEGSYGTQPPVENMTDYFYWESSDESIAAVSNVPGSKGVVTWQQAGKEATITASRYFMGKKVSGTVKLTGPPSLPAPSLSSLTIHPDNKSYDALPISQQYYLTAVYSDGSIQNVTADAAYETSDAAVTISAQSGFEGRLRVAKAPASQPVTITATYEGKEVSTMFNVLE